MKTLEIFKKNISDIEWDSKKEEIINCLTNYEKDLLSNEISEENLINTKKNRL
ncbi:TPA: hypothetical protein NV714_002072 [Escherichia coli]|nr:hypothetical protein [Escherichia coli]